MPTVVLPTLHAGQVAAYSVPGKRVALRCGRRWGKTEFLTCLAADGAAKGQRVGVFAPENKFIDEPYESIKAILSPIQKTATRQRGRLRTTTGGHVDFWSLDKDLVARGRKYHLVLIDEAARTKPNMWDIWTQSIKPTLVDYGGTAFVMSNTKGNDPTNFLYRVCKATDTEFTDYHAPTHSNPFLPVEELAKLQAENHPLVYRQEYLAEFVDFSGEAFFSLPWMLVDGQPVQYPQKCDAVFAVIDTAMKDRVEHDGTAVSYFATSQHYGHPLTLLDWDTLSIEGSLLEQWLPSVYMNLQAYAAKCGARRGVLGVWIEDAQSGTILLQQAQRRGWKVFALPENLKAAGKNGRALNVSAHVYQGKLKLSQHAYDKTTSFKGTTMNHWLHQVTGFRIGAKEGALVNDDLLDTMTYGVAIALGNSEGY